MALLGSLLVRDESVGGAWARAGATRPFIAAVLDGLGGHQGGDQASARVARRLATSVGRWALDVTAAELGEGMRGALGDARRELAEAGARDEGMAGAGTTCTALLVADSAFVLVHVGDSRCYRRRDGVWKQMTSDHALVVPDASGARVARLTHAVGGGVGELPNDLVTDLTGMCFPGDVYLLVTDGVVAAVGNDAELEPVLDAHDAQGVLDRALARGDAPDNATAVRLEIIE